MHSPTESLGFEKQQPSSLSPLDHLSEAAMSKTYPTTTIDDESAVCWGAIFAGAFAAGALTLMLGALGTGTGLALIPSDNITPTTVNITTGLFLVVTAIISSTVGGYMAGRLRTKWSVAPAEEVLFRDTAHGFTAWALASVVLAAILGTGTLTLLGASAKGLFQGASQGATQNANAPTDYFVDMLLRPAPTTSATGATSATSTTSAPADAQATRREVGLIFTRDFGSGGKIGDQDRSYLVQVVSSRTGLSQDEAAKRVDDVLAQTKAYLDSARKHAIGLALWVTLSLFAGAFAASAAAIEGGQLRDGRWRGVLFVPRAKSTRG
jgi:hypothetical protein